MTDDKTYKEISERIQADAFHNDCNLSVLCEDIHDNSFWRCIIENAKPCLKDKLDFPLNPEGTRGKDVLKKLKKYVNKKMIICVDSDCEYLYDNNVWYIDTTYIYHTIVHSRENFQCNHLSLNEICKQIADKSYDFRTLFENISKSISIIFYIWVHLKEIRKYSSFNQIINNEQFRKILDFEGIQYNSLEDEINLYQTIEDRVNDVLKNLKASMEEGWYKSVIEYEVPQLRTKLIEQYEIHPEEILSFFYGHGVLENLVEPLTIKITDLLKKSRIEEVTQGLSQASEKDRSNTISSIKKASRQDVKTKIGDSFLYIIYAEKNKYIEQIQQKLISELSCD
jgi:ASC-1-like (ASCH) protein